MLSYLLRHTAALWLGLTLALALSACGAVTEPPAAFSSGGSTTRSAGAGSSQPAGAPAAAEAALQRAEQAIGKLATTLSRELMAAMKDGGPSQAIRVCADRAQQLSHDTTAATGVSLGRASLALRNPDNRGPDWVRRWLQNHGVGKGEGKGGAAKPLREVVDTDAGRVARIIKPITVGAKCLSCHGSEVAPDVTALLADRYPGDAARGYQAGDLRGAFWAEAPVR